MLLPERITLVLRAPEGATLEQVLPFALLGAHVSIGRGLAVISAASQGDLQAYMDEKAQELGREREEHQHAMEYCERALGMHPLLVAHAREMYDLLRLINVKVGGLRAVCDHGGDPSDLMWEQFDEALDAIWPLMETLAPALVDKGQVNQNDQKGENVNQPGFSIDEHVKLVADARRYRHLRDRTCIEDADTDLLVLRGDTYFTGEELDREIDVALRLEAQEQQP
ncbi:hypothetical protein [Pseudomonas mosselii]|uniref:hypothetical protein n=1 Tax=Pseudomonas mosselii TaxID=78327 RepID=UPI001E3D0796|nr:hypothetical protein [Pseudomonas mosselii]MCL8302265.1 hypothetical protein [Pseudomonas mosselii]MCL8342924.1 hypothetical protein [Pseudomonas mosselii]WJR27810.1 hypothetical protein LU678_026210 [Pseudomonas mosselii]